eukprot:CAMPEP_0119311300 /NCGR_PEP_ID=MMETSP1333-20130426/22030_1 /TAXON_ID=418940 /ORGANISM="Scyphosphaera apsteinii, Strain RCC1455" /LENGTH=275 /DNA_ID=CAMNT_0007315647 /DNA_START=91 /DNA_END=918 /DNA_ORIENTATION=-
MAGLAAYAFHVPVPTSRSSFRRAHSPTRQLLIAKRKINLLTGKSNLLTSEDRRRRPNMQRMLAGALGWGLSCRASADDLLLACVSPGTYGMLREWRRQAYGEDAHLRLLLAQTRQSLLGNLESSLKANISVRTKGLWSTFNKVCVREQPVHDTLALRIVINGDEENCKIALKSVQQLWPSMRGRFKNYITSPKPNGYRALHDTVLLPCGTPLEVQVRTKEMHQHAECGTASHRNYKGPLEALPSQLVQLVGGMASLVLPAPRPALVLASCHPFRQ